MEKYEKRMECVISLLKGYFGITLVKRILCAIMLALEVDAQKICNKLGLTYISVKKYERILDSEAYMLLLKMGKHEKPSELDDYKEVILR